MGNSLINLGSVPVSNDSSFEDLRQELIKVIERKKNVWLREQEILASLILELESVLPSNCHSITDIYLDKGRADLIDQLVFEIKNRCNGNSIVIEKFEELKKTTLKDIERDDIIHTVFNEFSKENSLVVIIHSFESSAHLIQGNDYNWLNKLSNDNYAVSIILISKTHITPTSSIMNTFIQKCYWDKNNPQLSDNHFIKPNSQNMHNKPVKLFISYSHKDEAYKDELKAHLSGMKRSGMVEEWNDRQILPGQQWDDEIKSKLAQSHIVIFLVSSDFMNSDYIADVEIKNTLDKYHEGKACVIPVIIRSCDFPSLGLSKFQALPKDAKPVKSWRDPDAAWLNVINGIKNTINSLDLIRFSDISRSTTSSNESPSRNITQKGDKSIYIENLNGDINLK